MMRNAANRYCLKKENKFTKLGLTDFPIQVNISTPEGWKRKKREENVKGMYKKGPGETYD